MPYADHISRLKAIVKLMHQWEYGEPLTKHKIVEILSATDVHDASAKTIQRAIRELQKGYDAPIEYSAEQGFHLTDKNWFCDFDLDEIELHDVHALALATELTAHFKGTSLHTHLSRLETILKKRREQLYGDSGDDLSKKIQFLSPPAAAIDPYVWDAVMIALLDRRWMEIQYCKYGDQISEMTIAPCRLVSLENEWYLFSEKQTTMRPQIRQLAMRNIRCPKVLPSKFTNAHEKEINKMLDHRFGWFACDRDIQQVTVVFDKAIRYLVDTRIWQKKQSKRTLENGDLEISFPTSAAGDEKFRFFEVRKWILAYGRYVKSVSPPKLKQYVLDDQKATQSNLME